MTNVSMVKYIPNDTIIHKLDPRFKIFFNILFIVMIFMAKTYLMQAVVAIPLLMAFFLSKMKPIKLITLCKPLLFLLVFLFLINIFLSANDPIIYASWWKINISYNAIDKTLKILLRVYLMIIATTLLTSTTKSLDLTRGLEDLLYPFKWVKLPVHIIAMIISIALRFIPTLLEEAQRIMKAQASRGVDFKNGGFKAKVKSTITLIIPLFVSAFTKAEDLSNAMETRGYDPYEKRTRYRKYVPTWRDALVSLFSISVFVTMIILQWTNVVELPTWWY
ncbi:MAG: energy-coupling factor transporter transmembrane protein EcfT [Mycoplasma sp.]|nr:energy-coupling factor transporter transmembrane protein EcfT [Mycoplasma sp.]